MRRADPERIYQAQRAGFLARMVTARRMPQERAEAVLHALEAECAALGLERGSPEFWREAERRAGEVRWSREQPSGERPRSAQLIGCSLGYGRFAMGDNTFAETNDLSNDFVGTAVAGAIVIRDAKLYELAGLDEATSFSPSSGH